MDLKNKINFTFFIGIVLILHCVIMLAYAQEKPASSEGSLKFYIDNAAFKGEENKTYLEYYLMIYADQLEYSSKQNEKHGVFKVSCSFKNIRTGEENSEEWITDAILNNHKNIKAAAFYDQWADLLEPGEYQISIEISDQNSLAKGTADYELIIPSMNNSGLSGSQIEFALKIEKSDEETRFTKNKNNITPNPSRRYGILNPVLFLYYELYNISEINDHTLRVHYLIEDIDQAIVKNMPEVKIKNISETISLMHGINVSSLSSGVYTLRIKVLDDITNEKTLLSRKFEIIQPEYFAVVENKNTNAQLLTDQQAEIGGRYLKYIASSQDYDKYKMLNETGKAEFLIEFWKKHDPSPGTDKNEYLETIQKRYLFSNENFGWGKIEGWATDRGRILIKYGMPDEIERYHFETSSVPYEIWFYRDNKKSIFVFADQWYTGKFALIHSTEDGEVQNYYWRELISKL